VPVVRDVREYAFELSLCAGQEARRSAIVARQLGGGVSEPGGRILDVVFVEPGATFEKRASITAETIPWGAIEADVGPGRFRPVTEVIDGPRERARRIAERAAEIGFFELERRGRRRYVRQVTRYPEEWFGELIGIENKPDLDRPGALETQLRTDVSLGVVDRAVLATASHVTGAHLNRIPEPVGVWQVKPSQTGGDIEVVREPEQLPTDEPGVELLDRTPGRADVRIVDADAKARARRRIAERAYGKGWRPTELPACGQLSPTEAGCPYCEWAGRIVEPARECGAECPGYDPVESVAVDLEKKRDRRSPWVGNPAGCARRQVGLDRFREE
jgi:hypothetical protein